MKIRRPYVSVLFLTILRSSVGAKAGNGRKDSTYDERVILSEHPSAAGRADGVVYHPAGNLRRRLVSMLIDDPKTVDFKKQQGIQFSRHVLAENVPHLCGTYKCIFPVNTNKDVGFLVMGHDDRTSTDLFIATQKGWELAATLTSQQETYDMDHVYLSAPRLYTDKGEDIGSWLDQQNTFMYFTNTTAATAEIRPVFKKFASFIVQEVAIFNKDHDSGGDLSQGDDGGQHTATQHQQTKPLALTFGCFQRKYRQGWAEMEERFLNPLLQLNPRERQQVHDQLLQQETKLRQLVQDFPCLLHDFQVFLLPNGRLAHFDMDRCFSADSGRIVTAPSAEIQICMERIDELFLFLVTALSAGEIPPRTSQ
jgi:hypothetical protein